MQISSQSIMDVRISKGIKSAPPLINFCHSLTFVEIIFPLPFQFEIAGLFL